MKESSDIDLLVPTETATEARRLLIDLDYETSLDNPTEGQFERYVRHAREAGFADPRSAQRRICAGGSLRTEAFSNG